MKQRSSTGGPAWGLAVALGLARLAAAQGEAGSGPNATVPRTNLVVLVADDLGLGDLSCYGGWIRTPHIDSLATQGALFTQAYSAAPVGTPSRAGLFTGMHPARLGVQANTGPNKVARKRARGLPEEVLTIPERLHGLGYVSGLIGKWHLGLKPGMTPASQGFDEFFGFLGAAHAYLPNKTDTKMLRGEEAEPEHEKEYLTDAFAREAEAYLVHHKDQPFALTLAFNAPHIPYEATEEYLARCPKLEGDKQAYAAMVSALDDAVGRVLTALDEQGLTERTLVVFTSDNGADIEQATGSNDGLALGKAFLFEGGDRVPMLVRWPGHVAPGATLETPVSLLDVAATTLELAGAPMETLAQLDGRSLLPLLAGEDQPERAFLWKLGPSAAIRKGNWKLITSKGSRWLFDLDEDRGEKNDLLDKNPDVAERLMRELVSWTQSLPEPLWSNEALPSPVPVLGKDYWVEY